MEMAAGKTVPVPPGAHSTLGTAHHSFINDARTSCPSVRAPPSRPPVSLSILSLNFHNHLAGMPLSLQLGGSCSVEALHRAATIRWLIVVEPEFESRASKSK